MEQPQDGEAAAAAAEEEQEQQQQQQQPATNDPKAARKAAAKAAKAAKRAQRAGDGPPDLGRKPCTLCSRSVDLLVRCQTDATGRWHMACGACWLRASGGRVDGTAATPHYRYGGLWKNHHAQLSGRRRVPKTASQPGDPSAPTDSPNAAAEEAVEAAAAGGSGGDGGGSSAALEQLLLAEAAGCLDGGDG